MASIEDCCFCYDAWFGLFRWGFLVLILYMFLMALDHFSLDEPSVVTCFGIMDDRHDVLPGARIFRGVSGLYWDHRGVSSGLVNRSPHWFH
jgi:hypothetical protein